MIHINWKKTLIIVIDLVLAVYIGMAVTSWNKPDEGNAVCTKVDINIEDESINGFLNTDEIKRILKARKVYPLSQRLSDINVRQIEDVLRNMPFVRTAECFVSQDGHITITITQRTPIIRVKADNGDDYYIDDAGGEMPNTKYTSDMIIVTGKVTRQYARNNLGILAQTIMADDFWRNQIEQINVMDDLTLEIIPRVGNHIINFGALPKSDDAAERRQLIEDYIKGQFHRMDIFYKHGLANAGWNKYSYISLEFANQVVCTRRGEEDIKKEEPPQPAPETEPATTETPVADNAGNAEQKPEDVAKVESRE